MSSIADDQLNYCRSIEVPRSSQVAGGNALIWFLSMRPILRSSCHELYLLKVRPSSNFLEFNLVTAGSSIKLCLIMKSRMFPLDPKHFVSLESDNICNPWQSTIQKYYDQRHFSSGSTKCLAVISTLDLVRDDSDWLAIGAIGTSGLDANITVLSLKGQPIIPTGNDASILIGSWVVDLPKRAKFWGSDCMCLCISGPKKGRNWFSANAAIVWPSMTALFPTHDHHTPWTETSRIESSISRSLLKW